VTGPHDSASPLAQARLVLTVIDNPPSGTVTYDNGTAILGELRSWYRDLVERFGEAVIMAAASRRYRRLPARSCYFCLAQAIARYRGEEPPQVSAATIELLGKPCARHPLPDPDRSARLRQNWTTVVASIPPGAPPTVLERLKFAAWGR